jgi:hypothetical protein
MYETSYGNFRTMKTEAPVSSSNLCQSTEMHDVASHYTTVASMELRILKATSARCMCYIILNSS